MIYKTEDMIKGKDRLMAIGTACWNEVDQLNKDFEFDPDWDRYSLLNDLGMVRYYTMYNDDEEFVGFCLMIINPCLHCKGKFVAVSDCIYIHPKYRKTGTEFINLIIEDLREEGVHIFSLHIKAWMDTGNLAPKIGCTHYENVLQRVL